jgi:hydroxymethylbilane synthase
MKDVPTQLPKSIIQAAVLQRGPVLDLLVLKTDDQFLYDRSYAGQIATSSVRRKAQWLHRYSHHQVHNLRGNVNTRLKKLANENWDGAIFAQAGLERLNLRPENSIVLDWMLPAPSQGAIVVVCREDDTFAFDSCRAFNHEETALCTGIEKQFLRTLAGGCSTPISAYAEVIDHQLRFRGNIFSLDGKQKVEIEKLVPLGLTTGLGNTAALELLEKGGKEIADAIPHEK